MSKASNLLVEVTIPCCYFARYYIPNLLYMSGFLSTWVGLLSNRVGLLLSGVGILSNGVGLFLRERVFKNMPTPLLEQPLKFTAHGCIFKRLQ